jgi:hypothetical protein
MKNAVIDANPASERSRKVKPVIFGRAECRTSTSAGITFSGDYATTLAGAMSCSRTSAGLLNITQRYTLRVFRNGKGGRRAAAQS